MRVTAGIATKGDRPQQLRRTLASLVKQVDKIYIYDNSKNKDLTDNAKFWGAQFETGVFLTCDDDIIYPKDYVKTCLQWLEQTNIVTYHGRIINKGAKTYYGAHKEYAFYNTVESSLKIDIAGTGVMAMSLGVIDVERVISSPYRRMSDLVFSLEAAKEDIILAEHRSGWIRPQKTDSSIYSQRGDQSQHVELVNKIISERGL